MALNFFQGPCHTVGIPGKNIAVEPHPVTNTGQDHPQPLNMILQQQIIAFARQTIIKKRIKQNGFTFRQLGKLPVALPLFESQPVFIREIITIGIEQIKER